MTTPAAPAAPTISLATDKASYNVGDTLTLTVTYADAQSQASNLTIDVSASDSQGHTVTSSVTVVVTQTATEGMTVTATDSFNGTWTLVSNDGKGTAVLSTVIGTPPAA